MGEDEGCTGDAANFAGAGGDVLEGAPAAGEQGKPAFAQAAQGALDGVAGTGIEVRLPTAGGLFDGNQDAMPASSYPESAKVGRPVAAAW